MVALKRLLVATDFSAMASHAVERASLIARQTGASLDLIHVARPEPLDALRRFADGSFDDAVPARLETISESLRQQAARLLERHQLVGSAHVARGPLIAELISHSRALPADLIVLGFCGASLMRHFLLGSTVERMITKAFCPLLVVKQAADAHYRSVLVPVDFSPVSLPTLVHARAIAPDAEIAVQHVVAVPFESKLQYAGVAQETIYHHRIVARRLATRKLLELCLAARIPQQQSRVLVSHGHPSQQIVRQERSRNCDLIVIGKQGENALENLLIGSVTRQVVAKSQGDVLITV